MAGDISDPRTEPVTTIAMLLSQQNFYMYYSYSSFLPLIKEVIYATIRDHYRKLQLVKYRVPNHN